MIDNQKMLEDIRLTYSVLVNQHVPIPRYWGEEIQGPFSWYERSFFENKPPLLNVLSKVQDLNFRNLYRKEYKELNSISKVYLDAPCVKFKERAVGIHFELHLVLFLSLFRSCREDIKKMLTLFNSPELENIWKYDFKEDDQSIQLSDFRQKEFLEVFRKNLGDTDHTLRVLQTGNILFFDGRRWVIEKNKIWKFEEQLDKLYDFEKKQNQFFGKHEQAESDNKNNERN